jgi:Ca2+-binding RTX toxin-like protein
MSPTLTASPGLRARSPMRRARRLLLGAAALPAALAAMAIPEGAEAASLTTSGSTIQYQAAAGETNGLRVFTDATGGIVLDDVVAVSETSPLCGTVDATSVRCSPSASTIAALLGDRNDSVFTQNSVPLTVDGGAGDDTYLAGFADSRTEVRYTGNSGRDVADYRHATSAVTVKKDGGASDGRSGDRDNIAPSVENLVGSRFDDTLEGSDTSQFERYDGLAGNDTMRGHGGPDIFLSGTAADGADAIFGGNGTSPDTMSHDQRTQRVVVTANFFDKDDGAANEQDTVREIESVLGGLAGDDIAGSGSSSTPLFLLGGPGGDRLTGTAGGDSLIGQAGADTLSGRGGDDSLAAIDGELDTLFCGDGIDTANRDRSEQTVLSCEAGFLQ